jgi:hypothetical protein
MPYRFAAARTAVVGENQKKIKRKKTRRQRVKKEETKPRD